MKKSRFNKEPIALALKQAEGSTRVAEFCRKMGIFVARVRIARVRELKRAFA